MGAGLGEPLHGVTQLELAQEGQTPLLGRLGGFSVWFSGVKPPRVPVASLRVLAQGSAGRLQLWGWSLFCQILVLKA